MLLSICDSRSSPRSRCPSCVATVLYLCAPCSRSRPRLEEQERNFFRLKHGPRMAAVEAAHKTNPGLRSISSSALPRVVERTGSFMQEG